MGHHDRVHIEHIDVVGGKNPHQAIHEGVRAGVACPDSPSRMWDRGIRSRVAAMLTRLGAQIVALRPIVFRKTFIVHVVCDEKRERQSGEGIWCTAKR